MKISIVCSSKEHPIYSSLESWAESRRGGHEVEVVSETRELSGGDILFLISCSEIVKAPVRERYAKVLVVHASDLPKGRGWSPHIWQILEGARTIPVCLLEALDEVDTGSIWTKRTLELQGHELYDEINAQLFVVTLDLMDFAIEHVRTIVPQAQRREEPSYYRKRTPEDSRLDPHRTIAEQFDSLRVADPMRFPSFFDYRGKRYRLYLEKEVTP